MSVSRSTAWSAVCATLLAGALQAQSDHTAADKRIPTWSDLIGEGSQFKLYGFLRLDGQWSDSRFQDNQIPGFVQSEDPAAPSSIGAMENDGDFSMHSRLTRLGFDFKHDGINGLGNPELSGNVEVDFYNIGLGDSDSRSALRMRKAYLQLKWEEWSVLAGQTWDLISPLYPVVNSDLVMWGAGNLGDRRPQLRVERKSDLAGGTLTFTGGIGLAGAVSSVNVENSLQSGENSELPMFAARLGWSGKTDDGGSYQIGAWGHYSEDDYDPAGGTATRDFESWSAGVDFQVPLVDDTVWIKGEAWTGENLDDVRGGIFQGVNGTTGQGIGSTGGFAELGWKSSEHLTLHAGYSADDPDNGDLGTGMRANNRVMYAAARWKYDALRFGVEYLFWTTDYIGFDDGDSNRVAVFAAYYF